MEETGQPFDVALAVTRAGTSSPPTRLWPPGSTVSPGADRAISRRLCARRGSGISLHDLLALGRQNPDDSAEPFNMAYLAMRGSGAVNGVSRLHGEVSRRLFQPLFPRWPEDEVPSDMSPTASTCPPGIRPRPTTYGPKPAARTAGWGRRKPGAGHSPDLRRELWQLRTAAAQVAGRICARTPVPASLPPRARRPRRSKRARRSLRSQRV